MNKDIQKNPSTQRNKKVTYSVLNKNTNELINIRTLQEITDIIGLPDYTLSYLFKRNGGEFDYDEFKVKKIQAIKNVDNIEITTVANNHFRTIEGEARAALTKEQFEGFIKRRNEKKERLNKMLNNISDKNNLPSEIEKKEKWEKHLKRCCTLSNDGKTYIPNSLLKDLPQLRNIETPKCFL